MIRSSAWLSAWRVSYETGWSLGGDMFQKPIQNYAKFQDPRAAKINDAAINNLHQSGAQLPVWGVYLYWPPNDFVHGRDYPLMQSVIGSSCRLEVDADNGLPLPATLTPANSMQKFKRSSEKNKVLVSQGDWIVWTVICPATGDYVVAPAVTGDGKFVIEADGQALPFAGSAKAPQTVKLTKGVHGIRIRRGDGEMALIQIEVKSASAAG